MLESILLGITANFIYEGGKLIIGKLDLQYLTPSAMEEIKKAHEEALNKWSKNQGAKDRKILELKRLVQDDYQLFNDGNNLDGELAEYLNIFKQTISTNKYQNAFRYLTNKQYENYFKQIVERLEKNKSVLSQDLDEIKTDTKKILEHLEPYKQVFKHKKDAKFDTDYFIQNLEKAKLSIERFIKLESDNEFVLKTKTLKNIILTDNKAFIILKGLPGSGKSFELQKLANDLWNDDSCDLIPFYRNLRDFTTTHTIESFFDLKRINEYANIVFILDGLDEIKDEDDFLSKFNSHIDNLVNKSHRFILSCRSNVVENYKTELERFDTYELLELNLNQAKLLLQQLTGNSFEENELNQFSEKSLFLKDPYKLNLVANYYNENSTLESNSRLLWEMYFNKILDKDKRKLKKKSLFHLSQKKDSKIIAFLLEITKVLNISEEEIYEILNCNENRANAFINLAIIYSENSIYFFEHKQLQEYLASLILVKLDYYKIVEIIKVNGTASVKPSMFNTVSLLLDTLDNDDKKDKLITWLTENEPELLFNADTDRVASYKEKVFQSYFQKNCIDTTIWFNQASSVPLDRIARFADSDVNFEYLLGIAEEKTHNFRIRTSAIEVLAHFKSRKDSNTKERLLGLLSPNKHDGYININSSILRLFLSWKLYKTYNELIIHIINKFEGDDHSAITNGILKLIHADIKNVESYKEFLDREFEFVFNEVKRKNDDKVSRGNRWTFEQIIEGVDSNQIYLKYLKKLIHSKFIEYNYDDAFFKRYSNKFKQINSTEDGRKLIISFFTELFTEKKQDYRTRDIAFILLKNLSLEYELFQMLFNPTNFKKLYHVCARLYVLDSRCHIVLEEKIDDFISIKPELEYFRNVINSYGKNNEAVKVENLITQKGYKLKESVSDKPSYTTIKDEYFKKSQQDLENIFDVDYLSNKIQEYFESNQPLFSVNKYYDKLDEYNPLYMKFGYNAPEYLFLLDLARFEDKEEMTKDFCIEKLTNWKYHSHFVFNFISNLLNDSNKQTLDFSGVSKKLQLVIDQFIQNADFNKMIIFNENGRHSYSCYLTFTSVQNIHEIMFKNELNIKVPDDFILKTISFFGYKSYSLQLSDFEKITNLVDDKVKLRTKICSNLKNKLLFQIKEVHILFALKHNYVESFIDIRSYFLEIDEIYNHDKLLDAYVEKQGISILKELITTKGVESRSCWASINILLKSEKDEQLQINTALNYLSLCKSENLKEKLFLENASNILFHYNRTEIIDFIVEDLPNRLNIIFKNSMVNFSNYDCLPSSGTQSLVELFHEIYKPRDEDDFTLAYLNRFISTYLANLVKNKGLFDELNTLFINLKKEIEEVNDESKQYYVNQVLRDIKNAYINKLSKGLEHEEAIRIIKNLDI